MDSAEWTSAEVVTYLAESGRPVSAATWRSYVARDQAPTVKILDQTYGDYDQMAIRVTARYDAAPLNPEAIVVLRGITL